MFLPSIEAVKFSILSELTVLVDGLEKVGLLELVRGSDERKIKVFSQETFWENGLEVLQGIGIHWQVKNFSGSAAFEMGMGGQIRTEAGGGPVKVHLPDQSAVNQSFQAVVNGCQRDGRQFFTNPQQDFVCGWMIFFSQNHFIHGSPLLGRTQTFALQSPIQTFLVFVGERKCHRTYSIW